MHVFFFLHTQKVIKSQVEKGFLNYTKVQSETPQLCKIWSIYK